MTITVKCYRELKTFDTREEAKQFFIEAMAWSGGSELERYAQIYRQLHDGLTYCSDEDDNYTNLIRMGRMLKGDK